MSVANHFHFIGVCYGDCQKIIKKKDYQDYYTKVILVVKTAFNDKSQYVPIVFVKSLSDKASLYCRNGNLVSVAGELTSREHLDRLTGKSTIELNFIATDIMLIKKTYKQRLSSIEFSGLINNFSPDEYKAEKGDNNNG